MRLFTAAYVPLAFFALVPLPATLWADEARSPRPLVIVNPHCLPGKAAPLSEDEDLAHAERQLHEDIKKGKAEFVEQVRSLKLEHARGLITAEQAKIRGNRILEAHRQILQDLTERQTQLQQRAAALDKARTSAAKAGQPPGLEENERAILQIFDVAEREGKVPAEWLVGAREIVRSGTYDAKSLAHVATALALCLSQLTEDEEDRAKYLRIAKEACDEYHKADRSTQPEAENLSSLVQELQGVDPRSADFQKRAAEIRAKMKATMDAATDMRRAVISELEKKAEEAERRVAENDREIAAIRERMKERQRRMDAMGY